MGWIVKRTTIKDVAKKAGVSITTVSHALSGGGVVKEETRAMIRAIAREMNYVPSWNGKNLKSDETKIIGLYVQYIRGFYGQLADAMSEVCHSAGYELNVFIANDGRMVLDNLLSRRVDGAIILHDDLGSQEAEIIVGSELPLVFLDREITGLRASCVLFDSYQTGWMAGDYLYGLGHRSFLLVEGKKTYDGIERGRGFEDCLKMKGIGSNYIHRIYGGFDRAEAFHETEDFLTSGTQMPTAVFAANDDSAIGCIQALQGAGYSIPEDISVMGCDNIELGQWYVPSLTTIDIGITRQGKTAAEEVIALINRSIEGRVVKSNGCLVQRASSKNIAEEL